MSNGEKQAVEAIEPLSAAPIDSTAIVRQPPAERLRAFVRRLYRSPTVWVVAGLAGSNLIATLVHAVGALVQANFVRPEDLGYFRGFTIATGYLYFLQLGTLEALQRRYPILVGRDQRPAALAAAEVTRAWSLAICWIVGGGYAIAALYCLGTGRFYATGAWLVQIAAYLWMVYGNYLGVTYRTNHKFRDVAKSSLMASITSLLTLPFFPFWPYWAMCARAGLVSLAQTAYQHLRRPLRIGWRFTWPEWRSLVGEGIPIFSAYYVQAVGWLTVEGTLILRFAGAEALGLWSMSLMVMEAARQIPLGGTTVYIPRIEEHFGRTGSVRACWALARRPMLLNLAGALCLAAFAYLALPWVIGLLMPKYVAAVPCMQLMLLYLPLAALELPFYILRAMGKIVAQNAAALFGLGVFLAAAAAALGSGWGLTGIVGASMLGKFAWLACVYGFVYRRRDFESPSKGIAAAVAVEEVLG